MTRGAFNSLLACIYWGVMSAMTMITLLPAYAANTTPVVVYSFGAPGPTAYQPSSSVIRTPSGNIYIAANESGSVTSDGAIVKITPQGVLSAVLSFTTDTTGGGPTGLVMSGGYFYGTNQYGGVNLAGVLYRVKTNGTDFKVLHAFANGVDGGAPVNIFIDGNKIFGTTLQGGANSSGVLYRISLIGVNFKVLHNFNAAVDGAYPETAPIKNSKGQLLGATSTSYYSGSGLCTIYVMNEDGTGFETVYTFPNAEYPTADQLVMDSMGNIYGATISPYPGLGTDTIFKIDPSETTTPIVTIDGSNGQEPASNLVLASNGLLYGATTNNGLSFQQLGTLYSINPEDDSYTTIDTFDPQTTGPALPTTFNLTQGSDGMIYGASTAGGTYGLGTIYRFQP